MCFLVRDSIDAKPPSTKHVFFEGLSKNSIFEIVAYSRRVEELEATYVYTRFNKKKHDTSR